MLLNNIIKSTFLCILVSSCSMTKTKIEEPISSVKINYYGSWLADFSETNWQETAQLLDLAVKNNQFEKAEELLQSCGTTSSTLMKMHYCDRLFSLFETYTKDDSSHLSAWYKSNKNHFALQAFSRFHYAQAIRSVDFSPHKVMSNSDDSDFEVSLMMTSAMFKIAQNENSTLQNFSAESLRPKIISLRSKKEELRAYHIERTLDKKEVNFSFLNWLLQFHVTPYMRDGQPQALTEISQFAGLTIENPGYKVIYDIAAIESAFAELYTAENNESIVNKSIFIFEYYEKKGLVHPRLYLYLAIANKLKLKFSTEDIHKEINNNIEYYTNKAYEIDPYDQLLRSCGEKYLLLPTKDGKIIDTHY